jgi:hypothetical protein
VISLVDVFAFFASFAFAIIYNSKVRKSKVSSRRSSLT